MKLFLHCGFTAALLIWLPLLAGCGQTVGDKGVIVTGKITKGGQPLTVPNMESRAGTVKIELYPVHTGPDDQRTSDGTLGNTDGTFEIAFAGQGVPPGKYKLSVEADPGTGVDELGGKFSGEQSPIEVNIEAKNVGGRQDLGEIPLDKYLAPGS